MITASIILVYGLLVLVGGVMGYVRANSTASLVSGSIAGLLLIASAVAMMRNAYNIGWWVSLGIAVLLLARFGIASLNNFRIMPGGVMIVLSLIAILALLLGGAEPVR